MVKKGGKKKKEMYERIHPLGTVRLAMSGGGRVKY